MTSYGRLRRRGMVIATLCASAAGASMGLAFPLLSTALELRFGSGPIVGWNAAMGALSTLLAAPFTPWLLSLGRPRWLLAGAAVAAALLFLGFLASPSLWLWYPLRLAHGFAVTIVFVGSETWINQLARDAHRGRTLGLYASALALGLGIGAALYAVLGATGPAAYLAGALVMAAGGLALLIPAAPPRPPRGEGASPLALAAIWRWAPVALAAAAAFGAIETAAHNFLPVYALRRGFGETGVGVIMIAVAIGNIAMQAPLGWLSDRVGKRAMLWFCAGAGVALPLVMALAPASLWLTAALALVYAGIVVGMYAIGLALLGLQVPASRLAQGNAAFITCYGIGSLASPPVAGAMIDVVNPTGLLWSLVGFAALYLVLDGLLARKPRRDIDTTPAPS